MKKYAYACDGHYIMVQNKIRDLHSTDPLGSPRHWTCLTFVMHSQCTKWLRVLARYSPYKNPIADGEQEPKESGFPKVHSVFMAEVRFEPMKT